MQVLVIGYGSIGKRHADVLSAMNHEVSVISKRKIDFPKAFHNLKDASNLKPEYIIIASETSDHYQNLNDIHESGFRGKVLVEKPLFDKYISVPEYKFYIYVAYNLRFNPIIQKLREYLTREKIISVHYYAGQYLPTWRSGRNHLETYSAHKNRGGGVLRDLSHELDIIQFLFGRTKSFYVKGGRYSNVTVDSDDVYAFLFEQENCPVVSMQMNYLDRASRREIIVNTTDKSFKADLANKDLWINDEKLRMDFDYNLPYMEMHKAIIEKNGHDVCSLEEGMAIMKLIQEIEN